MIRSNVLSRAKPLLIVLGLFLSACASEVGVPVNGYGYPYYGPDYDSAFFDFDFGHFHHFDHDDQHHDFHHGFAGHPGYGHSAGHSGGFGGHGGGSHGGGGHR